MRMDMLRNFSRSNVGWFVALIELAILIAIAVMFRASNELDPGDLATWVSGFATLAAVVVALAVPAWQKAAADREKQNHKRLAAKLLAIESIDLIVRLRVQIIDARKLLWEAEHWHISQISQLIARGGIPGFTSLPGGAELLTLPPGVGACVAACRAAGAMYSHSLASLLDRHEATISARLAKSSAIELLDHVQAQLARLSRSLAGFEHALAQIDFLERGDGTSVDKLPDVTPD